MSRVLALDPGSVRIGVALSDPSGLIAGPRRPLDATDDRLLERIGEIVVAEDVATIVVGLPVRTDGVEGPEAEAARRLAADVGDATGVDVVLHDERYSSVTAEKALLEAGMRRERRRERRDGVAAAVFLQSYLDGRR